MNPKFNENKIDSNYTISNEKNKDKATRADQSYNRTNVRKRM